MMVITADMSSLDEIALTKLASIPKTSLEILLKQTTVTNNQTVLNLNIIRDLVHTIQIMKEIGFIDEHGVIDNEKYKIMNLTD